MIKIHLTTCICMLTLCANQVAWGQSTPEAEKSAAIDYFDNTFADTCQPFSETKWRFEEGEEVNPARLELSYKSEYASSDTGYETAIVYKFFCSSGAYSQQTVFLQKSGNSFVSLSFATPVLEIKYEDDQDEKVSSIKITGYTSRSSLTNSTFDPINLLLTEQSYWRGLGDAYQKTTFLFSEGQFVLKSFEVDASYDGQIEPQLLIDY
ncbi:MAG: hypothetical protein ABJO09_14920 [Hyphomicrobiales bacterium]